jgi:hypothetical protein
LLDHPGSKVLPFNRALGYGSTPRVHISLRALHGPGGKQVTERQRRALPQLYASAPASQTCRPSGASIPRSRTRVQRISMVSPSTTDARPIIPPSTRPSSAEDWLEGLARLIDRVWTAVSVNAAGSSEDNGLRYVASVHGARSFQDQENCGQCKR